MNKTTTITMGQRIKEQRKRLHYTQEQLAEIMNIPKSTISDYENDKCEIKTGRIMELANHLHTTPNYLFGYEEKNTSEDEAIMELLSKIKDKKMKDMIMAQIIFASKMEED